MSTTPRDWPENALPTAEQLAKWLERCTHAERVDFADRAQHAQDAASRCYIRNHGRVEDELRFMQDRAHRYRLAWHSAKRWRVAMRQVLGVKA